MADGRNGQDVADAVSSMADAAKAQYEQFLNDNVVFNEPDISPEQTRP